MNEEEEEERIVIHKYENAVIKLITSYGNFLKRYLIKTVGRNHGTNVS